MLMPIDIFLLLAIAVLLSFIVGYDVGRRSK